MSSATDAPPIAAAKLDVTEREFAIIEHAVKSEHEATCDTLYSDVVHGSTVDIDSYRTRLKRLEDASCALARTKGWTNQRPKPQPVYLTGKELSEMVRNEAWLHSDSADGFDAGDLAERAKQRETAARLLTVFDLHERLDAWASYDEPIEFHLSIVEAS